MWPCYVAVWALNCYFFFIHFMSLRSRWDFLLPIDTELHSEVVGYYMRSNGWLVRQLTHKHRNIWLQTKCKHKNNLRQKNLVIHRTVATKFFCLLVKTVRHIHHYYTSFIIADVYPSFTWPFFLFPCLISIFHVWKKSSNFISVRWATEMSVK